MPRVTRRHGALEPGAPPEAHDHAVWGYGSDAERAEVVCAWLGAGLDAGYRCLYVNDADPEMLLAEVTAIPNVDKAVAREDLLFMPTAAAYDLHKPIDREAQLALYASVVVQALTEGYAGLRVAADITPLVRDPARRRSHLAWEQYADAYIAERPLSPLCLYDTRKIAGIEAIACVHALQGPEDPGLAVFSSDGARAVHGEIDGFQAPILVDVLHAVPDDPVELDLGGVEFVDARGAWALNEVLLEMRGSGRPLRVRGVSEQLTRVWHICGLDESLLAS